MKYEEEIREILSDTINSIVPVDEIDADTKLGDAGMDSISFVELIIAIEDRFGIEVPNEALSPENNSTIHDLSELVSSLKKNGVAE